MYNFKIIYFKIELIFNLKFERRTQLANHGKEFFKMLQNIFGRQVTVVSFNLFGNSLNESSFKYQLQTFEKFCFNSNILWIKFQSILSVMIKTINVKILFF